MDVADWDWYWTLGQTTLHSRSSTLGLRAFKVIEKSKEMQNDRWKGRKKRAHDVSKDLDWEEKEDVRAFKVWTRKRIQK